MSVVRDIRIPVSLLRNPDNFGGRRVGDCLQGDLLVEKGRATGLRPSQPSDRPRMILPALIEAHCHLDKCHSIGRIGAVGGDLIAAIEAQREDKAHWTADDLRARAQKGLAELADAGCRAVRSHIDWPETPEPPIAWSVIWELAGDSGLVFQGAALTGIAQLADRAFCFETARQVAAKRGGVLGAFVLHHDPEDIGTGLRNAFAAAEQFGFPLDFHVDEGLGPFNGLEMICDAALESGFQGPLLCGHAVSLIDRGGDDLKRILEKLHRAGISVCALPTTNLYLQGRRPGTPDRRGLTRLSELQEAGVPIVVASDNVADAFCPTGQHDPLAALHLAGLAAHLDPPMGDWLPAVTLSAAAALGLEPTYVDNARLSDLRMSCVATTADLVAGRTPLLPVPLPKEATAS